MATDLDERVAEWRRFRRSLRDPQAHGSRLTPADTAQASTLSLPAYAQLLRPVHAFPYLETRATLAQHNYAHQIMHPPSTGEHRNYLEVAPGLEPRTTIQLHGNEMRPRVIHYADDIVLLFPPSLFLLCLLFYDAFSHHVFVFLFVRMNPEQRWHRKTRGQRTETNF